jgi:biopolymer transport protein ExbD
MKNRWHSSVGKLIKGSMTSDINVTPLVDVCLVLLIIFMVVTPMLQKGVPVNIPVTEDPETIHQRTPDREIAVKGDKQVKYGAVLDVLKACREVGFNNVGLIAQPKRSPGQGT